MTPETMRHALAVEAQARKIKQQFDQYVLLKIDPASQKEVINVGDPVTYRQNEFHRMQVAIPEAARQYVFRLWRKEIALKFNEHVRKLAQLGMTTDLRQIEFSSVSGEPLS